MQDATLASVDAPYGVSGPVGCVLAAGAPEGDDHRVLEMRPTCERCETALAADSPDARICSFECTFCASCTDGDLGGACPNCAGELRRRPTRAG